MYDMLHIPNRGKNQNKFPNIFKEKKKESPYFIEN